MKVVTDSKECVACSVGCIVSTHVHAEIQFDIRTRTRACGFAGVEL